MSESFREERANLLAEFDSLFPEFAEREKRTELEKQRWETLEMLRESVPYLRWKSWSSEKSGIFLITAFFVVSQFDGSEYEFPCAQLSTSMGSDSQIRYSVGFINAVEQFNSRETAIAWLLSRFRQFAVKESPNA